MNGTPHVVCQWNKCTDLADKHAVFGRRVFEAGPADSQAPYLTKHRDLCNRHIDELKTQYIEVAVMEIGTCRDHAPPRP